MDSAPAVVCCTNETIVEIFPTKCVQRRPEGRSRVCQFHHELLSARRDSNPQILLGYDIQYVLRDGQSGFLRD